MSAAGWLVMPGFLKMDEKWGPNFGVKNSADFFFFLGGFWMVDGGGKNDVHF